MPKEAKFETLFQELLEDLYDAEKQIAEALPKMIAASSTAQLSAAFEHHLEETKQQALRLEAIFERMAVEPGSRECKPMQALLEDGERLTTEFARSAVLDTALIAAGQKVEHFEIAAYGSVCSLAELLGQQDAFDLLQDSLQEEMEADESLAEIAELVIGGDSDDEELDGDEELEEEEEEEEVEER